MFSPCPKQRANFLIPILASFACIFTPQDIQFGVQGGMQTLLVYTGVSTPEEVAAKGNSIFPSHTLDSFGRLAALVRD